MANILIITGASKGIGYATAQLFIQHGWQIINISRTNCNLDEVQNFNLDLSDTIELETYSKKIITAIPKNSRVALVHNAAMYARDESFNINPEQLQQILKIALIAPTQLNKILIPNMAMGSSIIYIGSTLSEKAVAGAASYIISKHAVIGMMRATCQDLLTNPTVHTCCICPGFTETKMVQEHLKREVALAEQVKSRVAAKRLVQPEEIASLIYYAAENPVINGSVIHANLGQREE